MTKKRRVNPLLLLLMAMMMFAFIFAISSVTSASTIRPDYTCINKVKSTAYNKITVYYNKSYNVTHYYIYYRDSESKPWTYVGKSTKLYYTHTASTAKPIEVGKTYYYMVRAYNSKTKSFGDYNRYGYPASTKPNKPKMRSVYDVNNTVKVTWESSLGCTHYVVYRKTASTSWKKLGTVKVGTYSYTDKNPLFNQKAYYTVRAYNSKYKTYSSVPTGLSIKADYFTHTGSNVPDWYIPDAQVGYMKAGYVNNAYVNMRQSDSLDSPVIVVLRYNDIVETEMSRNGFYNCRAEHNGKMYFGWVSTDYVTFGFPKSLKHGYVNYGFLNLRVSPSTNSSINVVLDRNDDLLIISSVGEWYKVNAEHNGMYYNGYVSKEYVKLK